MNKIENNVDVSVIIISFNTKELTLNCINSIINYTKDVKYEIIVVDNASSDGSIEEINRKYQSVITIKSDVNIGFGRANNLASQHSKGKYLFFLNSDCILIENSIKKMFYYFELNNCDNNQIGAIGGILLDKNYNINTSYNHFPSPMYSIKLRIIELTNNIFKTKFVTDKKSNYKIDKNGLVDFISGADLFIPKNVFKYMNGFDPTFFLYYEETDLQKRMANNSLKRIILENVKIMHLEGGSTTKKLSSVTIFQSSEFKYMRKHYSIFIYIFYYVIMSVLLSPIYLSPKHSKKDKKGFFKMMLKSIS